MKLNSLQNSIRKPQWNVWCTRKTETWLHITLVEPTFISYICSDDQAVQKVSLNLPGHSLARRSEISELRRNRRGQEAHSREFQSVIPASSPALNIWETLPSKTSRSPRIPLLPPLSACHIISVVPPSMK